MRLFQISIDTNVLVAALRSRRGASFRLLSMVGQTSLFEINVSIPLVLEYEARALEHAPLSGLSREDIAQLLDYLCAVGNRHDIHFLWRPMLQDPKDEMLLELAVAAQCDFIVTFNKRDFKGVERFGIRVVTPQEFLQHIGVLR